MATRTAITKSSAPGAFTTAGVEVVFAAADVSNKNNYIMTSDELLVARNTGASTRTITVNSSADERGRVKDITTENILAGAYRVYGPFRSKVGWVQSGGVLHFEASNAEVEFSVIKLNLT